jgi:orotidine-5'-phosphate decarboxylase
MARDLRADESARPVSVVPFGDRLADAVDRKRSQLVVGLDPRPELLPVELRGQVHLGRSEAAEACLRFCCGLVDAVAPYAAAVKPQLAFFEALGPDGFRAFEEVCRYGRAAGLLVIGDGKRGDIGSTARAYADAYLEAHEGRPSLVDALTVNPYLGSDSIEPFVAACRRSGTGIFCLVKTSISRTWPSRTAGRSGTRSPPSSTTGARSSSASAASRASAPSSAPPTRAPSASPGA